MTPTPTIQFQSTFAFPKVRKLFIVSVVFSLALAAITPVAAAAELSLTPLTWNVIGLDSNNVQVGPSNFPIGVRVCNAGSEATNVEASFVWEDGLDAYNGDAYINLRSGSLSAINLASLAGAGACHDFYFEVALSRDSNAYDNTRKYHIEVTADGGIALSTPAGEEIYVEHLISQNRNTVSDIKLDGESVPPGGAMSLWVGNTYNIQLIGSTATQGYEQIESFITLPNTIFQVNSVTTTYSAVPNPHTDALWDTKPYANGCDWENDPNSPNYRSCLSTGKYGGSVTVNFNVTIISGAGTSQELSTLIYDFSGSSFHYNGDYSVKNRIVNILGAPSVTISKRFVPDAIAPGGTSTLMFTISNPTVVPLSGINFADDLPTTPDNMQVAATPAVSYSGCGSGEFSPALSGGETSISFSGGSIAANSSCTIKVDVTVPAAGSYDNTSGNLFININEDTGNNASDTLTAAEAAACTPGVTMARWDVPDGSSTNPPDTSGGAPTQKAANVSTATVAASVVDKSEIVTSGGSNDSSAWSTYGYKNAGQYVDFVIDTRHYSDVAMQFFMKNDGLSVGPTSVVVSYDSGGGFSDIQTINNPAASFTQYDVDLSGLTSASGNTTIRITGVGANNDNQGAGVAFDAMRFTGCSVAAPGPTLDKAFSTSPIHVGASSTLVFTFENTQAGNEALSNVQFSDDLPEGLQVADSPNAGTTGAGCSGVTFGPAASDTTINYSTATMSAGASCTAYVDVKATQAGQFENVSGYISSTESGPNNSANGYGMDTLTAVAAPEISKAFSASPILSGETSTLSFSVNNPNQSTTLTGVGFSDNLPAGLVVATPNGLNGSCGGGAISAVAGGSLVSLTGASLAGSSGCTFSVDVTSATPGSYDNVTTNVVADQSAAGNAATARLVVKDAITDINLLKQVSLTGTDPWTKFVAINAALPQDVYFRFIVENTGDTALSSASITDVAIPGLPSDCASLLSGGLGLYETVTCFSEAVSVSSEGAFSNVAYASGDTATSPNTTANYATSDLSLAKSVSESSFAEAGDVLHYSFVITNTGFAPLVGPVVVTDDKADDESCPALTTVGDLDNYLDPGEEITCTATYTVQAADVAARSVTNLASASADGVTSNTDTQTVTRAAMDFGDLPASYNATLLSDDGARHTLNGLYLGAGISSENDGQESDTAAADSNDDGVVAQGNWSDGTGNLQVTVTGGRACLMGWLDFWNGSIPYTPDGDFDDSSETIINNLALDPGTTPISFPLPANAANSGAWLAHFRLIPDADNDGDCSDQAAIGAGGLAIGGEVEDYAWSFSPTPVRLVELSARTAQHAWTLVITSLAALAGAISLFVLRRRLARR